MSIYGLFLPIYFYQSFSFSFCLFLCLSLFLSLSLSHFYPPISFSFHFLIYLSNRIPSRQSLPTYPHLSLLLPITSLFHSLPFCFSSSFIPLSLPISLPLLLITFRSTAKTSVSLLSFSLIIRPYTGMSTPSCSMCFALKTAEDIML